MRTEFLPNEDELYDMAKGGTEGVYGCRLQAV